MKPGIASFLECHRIAVVGVSRTSGFANVALKELRERGYEAFPVNEVADAFEGEPCYHSVAQVPGPVDGVLCVVPPAEAVRVVEDCARAGVKRLWLQRGSESDEAVARARAAGIEPVAGACILMYARPRGIHRFHALVERALGRL
ncbi:MAG: CoA-binding protein [Anaeromyxobacteraceae bacterium]